MTNKYPTWVICAFIGGMLTFLSLFMQVFEFATFYNDWGVSYIYNGIEMLSANELTPGKFLPLIIAILGLLVAVFSIYAALNKEKFPKGKTIVSTLIGITVILVIVYFIIVSTGSIVDWENVASWDPGATIGAMKEESSYFIPLLGSTIVIGPVVSAIGSFLSYNEE